METLCRLDQIPAGGCLSVDASDGKVLLHRLGDSVLAMDATCPHQGGDLGQGAVRDGLVICPLHHAVFELATGRRRHGPGLGDLRKRIVRVIEGDVAVGPRPKMPVADQSADTPDIVIVGAGAAGLSCAEALRRNGHDGPLRLLDAEDDPLYERTDLSKDVLAGAMAASDAPRLDAAALRQLGIETRFGERVIDIDRDERVIRLEGGKAIAYDLCFSAPGASARRPDLPGVDSDGVFTLRSAIDAQAFGAAARAAGSCVIVGGGFIGMEAAGALAPAGVDVTLIVRESAPAVDKLGADIAAMLTDHLRSLGVTIVTGEEAVAFEAEGGRLQGIRLSSGTTVPGQAALLALGEERHGSLAAETEGDGAVDVPASLRVAPGLWVGGDSAARLGERTRHWRAAEEDGRRAACDMLNLPPPPEPVDFFWTKIGAPPSVVALHVVGEVDPGFETVDAGDVEKGDFTRFFVSDGSVVGAVGCGEHDRTAAFHLALLRRGKIAKTAFEEVSWRAEAL